MPAHLVLTPAQLKLVDAYVESLRRVGCQLDDKALWPARAFGARVGSPQAWAMLSLQAQCDLPLRIRHFVSWLIVTQHVATSAEYIVVGRPFLGDVALRHHPAVGHAFLDTAISLGFARATALAQWSDVAKLAGLFQVRPDQLTRTQFDAGCAALIDAARKCRPQTELQIAMGKSFRGAEATLFHLGVFDAPPTRLGHTLARRHAARRAHQWAEVAPVLATTLRTYLEQIALTLRPSTVTRTEAVLREFAGFLAISAPDVRYLADVRRSHIEAFKRYLASRPAIRRGRSGAALLSRGAIAGYLRALNMMFIRLVEWAGDDAPARVLLFRGDFPILDKPLPRFLDDAASTKLLRAAREDTDPFVRLCVELLARTGLRRGEFVDLTVDAVVQIGSATGFGCRSASSTATATCRSTRSSKPSSTSGWLDAATACARTICSLTMVVGSPPHASIPRWKRSLAELDWVAFLHISCATRSPPRPSIEGCRWKPSPHCSGIGHSA